MKSRTLSCNFLAKVKCGNRQFDYLLFTNSSLSRYLQYITCLTLFKNKIWMNLSNWSAP
jgi:hypothetical protein